MPALTIDSDQITLDSTLFSLDLVSLDDPKPMPISADYIGLAIMPHNDLTLDETGNLVLALDAEAIGQHVRQRLMFWRGEWYLNQDAGVEWTRYVLGRPPSEIDIAAAIVKREILDTPGVSEIVTFDAEYHRSSRGFRINEVTVRTVFGDEVAIDLVTPPTPVPVLDFSDPIPVVL